MEALGRMIFVILMYPFIQSVIPKHVLTALDPGLSPIKMTRIVHAVKEFTN